MANSFFSNRALFWSFWANVLFLIGMVGYLFMDGFDYMRPNTLNLSLSLTIYVILAAIFVLDSTLQLLSIYNTSSYTQRYYCMVSSSVFDALGSNSYVLGAFLAAIAYENTDIIWTFNTIGVCGFAAGAIINMLVRGASIFYSWANILNLVGSLLYVLAVFVRISPWTQYITIFGDIVYLIDAILYLICWFSDRQMASAQTEQILLATK